MAYILLVLVCSIPFHFLFVVRSIRERQKIPKGRLNSFNLSCTGLNTPSYTIYFSIIHVHSPFMLQPGGKVGMNPCFSFKYEVPNMVKLAVFVFDGFAIFIYHV